MVRPANVETTALGAAFCAGLSAGLFDIESGVSTEDEGMRTYMPSMPSDERASRYRHWRDAVSRTLSGR